MSASIYEKIENQLLQLVEGGSVKALVQIRQKNCMRTSKISFLLRIFIISWHKLILKKLAKISEIKEDLEQAFQYYRKEFHFRIWPYFAKLAHSSNFDLSVLIIIQKTVKQCVKEASSLRLEWVLCMPMDRTGF